MPITTRKVSLGVIGRFVIVMTIIAGAGSGADSNAGVELRGLPNNTIVTSKDEQGRILYTRCETNGFCYTSHNRVDVEHSSSNSNNSK